MTCLHLSFDQHRASLDVSRERARRKRIGTYCVEGETVTVSEIAQRTGRSLDSVERRMRTLRKGAAVTWEGLA